MLRSNSAAAITSLLIDAVSSPADSAGSPGGRQSLDYLVHAPDRTSKYLHLISQHQLPPTPSPKLCQTFSFHTAVTGLFHLLRSDHSLLQQIFQKNPMEDVRYGEGHGFSHIACMRVRLYGRGDGGVRLQLVRTFSTRVLLMGGMWARRVASDGLHPLALLVVLV